MEKELNDPHEWTTIGEDTGGFVLWCCLCGTVKDSGGEVSVPEILEPGSECF
jgi:hypothetical protein